MTLSVFITSPGHSEEHHEVRRVILPSVEGPIGVLPRHAHMIVILEAGLVSVDDKPPLLISAGIAHIEPDRCSIMAEFFRPLCDLNPVVIEEMMTKHYNDLAGAEIDHKRRTIAKQLSTLERELKLLKTLDKE